MSTGLVHGTCVHVPGCGAGLLLGAPGTGKSTLALRLISEGGLLVADDQVEMSLQAHGWRAAAPRSLAGRLEVRGLGVVAVPTIAAAPLTLAILLRPGHVRPALAAAEHFRAPFAPAQAPALAAIPLDPREPGAAGFVRLALAAAAHRLTLDIAPR